MTNQYDIPFLIERCAEALEKQAAALERLTKTNEKLVQLSQAMHEHMGIPRRDN